MKTAAFAAFGVAAAAGLVLAATTAWWLVAVGIVCVVAAATTWWALLGLGFLARAGVPTRAVLGGATGPALIPVLAATGAAELIWSVLVAVPLFLVS